MYTGRVPEQKSLTVINSEATLFTRSISRAIDRRRSSNHSTIRSNDQVGLIDWFTSLLLAEVFQCLISRYLDEGAVIRGDCLTRDIHDRSLVVLDIVANIS